MISNERLDFAGDLGHNVSIVEFLMYLFRCGVGVNFADCRRILKKCLEGLDVSVATHHSILVRSGSRSDSGIFS